MKGMTAEHRATQTAGKGLGARSEGERRNATMLRGEATSQGRRKTGRLGLGGGEWQGGGEVEGERGEGTRG